MPGSLPAADRALVLLSGGLDSAVALWWAIDQGYDVVPLSFRYRGRPGRESRAARALAQRAGLAIVEADLPFLEEPAPEGRWRAAPRGYIPARNAIFYASAAYHAQILECDIIVGGHNRDDASRFPDANADFFARFERLLGEGLWRADGRATPRLVMPLHTLTKLEVVALGRELGVPLALAWSCYEDGEAPCGVCPSCVERRSVALAEG